jgi:hypothetical protein
MTAHPADHELIRLLDEGALAGNAALAAHLGACLECAERHAVLERRTRRVRDALAAGDPPARSLTLSPDVLSRLAARKPPRYWRIAAAFSVLMAGSLVVPPVRAWIAQRAGALLELASPRRAEPPAPPLARVPLDTAGRLSFAPTGARLIVDVAHHQAAGALVIATVADTAISALVVGEREGTELTVLPGGLKIANVPGATTSYLVEVPLDLTEVAVVVARGRPVTLRPQRAGERWRVELRRSR